MREDITPGSLRQLTGYYGRCLTEGTWKVDRITLCTSPILSSFVKAKNLFFVKLSNTIFFLDKNLAFRTLVSNSAIILLDIATC